VVILFATEIKRSVWAMSLKGSDAKNWDSGAIKENAKECTNEIIKAVQSMSKNNVGAIIILANSNIPSAILDSGVAVNSDISAALIESIFFPKTPLHDGAMIINGTKVQAAGCFLPLSQEINLPKDLGTRHRAGIGITETINVSAIIVSEETGVISVAHGGKLKRYADTEMLKNTLKSFYWQDMIG
jgi:diadenylate cyclase